MWLKQRERERDGGREAERSRQQGDKRRGKSEQLHSSESQGVKMGGARECVRWGVGAGEGGGGGEGEEGGMCRGWGRSMLEVEGVGGGGGVYRPRKRKGRRTERKNSRSNMFIVSLEVPRDARHVHHTCGARRPLRHLAPRATNTYAPRGARGSLARGGGCKGSGLNSTRDKYGSCN